MTPAFVDAPGAPGFLRPNPDLVQRFFPNPSQAPEVAIDTYYFEREKRPGSYRIFVQGESSAAGFPYGRWASPAGLLQQRLQRSAPEREIEVIGTGMASVTSYMLLDLVDEVIAQRPDAIVIYTGHNEYLGIGGVGSSLASAKSPAVARAVMRLRRLRLYRVIESALSPATAQVARSATSNRTLMARIAAERRIAFDSSLFRRGEEQFRGNLARILERYRAAGIPVFIGTLASNERDQPPFASSPPAAGEGSAQLRFARAASLDAAGQFAAARAEYLAAKDRDELRFRAPESFNAMIRALAAEHGAVVVDTQAAIAARAGNGIIGNDVMTEHVHPNLDGYFALASAFYHAIQPSIPGSSEIPDDVARAEQPVTPIDRLGGEYRVAVLKNDWPFVPERQPTQFAPPATAEEVIAQRLFAGQVSWPNAMNEAIGHFDSTGNALESIRATANLADAFVNLAAPQHSAAVLMLRANQPERALAYATRAVRREPGSPDYLLTLAEAQFRTRRVAQSAETLRKILASDPGETRARYWLGIVTQALQPQPASPPPN